jgi:integrase
MARRLNREGTYKTRPDGRIEGQVELVDAAGKRQRLSVYAKTKVDARRKVRDLIAKADGGTLTNRKPQTMAEYLLGWSQAPDLKRSTRRARDLNRRRVIPIIGAIQLEKLTPDHIRKVDNKLDADGLSGASRNQAFDVLKAAMSEAVRERLITSSPFRLINWVPPVAQREMRFLTAYEQAKLYSINDGWTPVWQFLLSTGLRSGECFGLSWKNVDLNAGRMSIMQAIEQTRGSWELHSPKTIQSRRTLQISPEVVDLLRGVKVRQDAEADRLGEFWDNPEAFVFTRDAGRPIFASIAHYALQKALKEAEIKRCRVHDLRHSFAAMHINGGTPPLAVSRMLGHSTVGFTLQVYGHLTTETQDAAAALSGRLLGEAVRLGQTLEKVN